MDARDIAIRTILGEAANESPMGQAAVAHVLQNRAADPRWPSTIGEVALQPKQFSAWNAGAGGNNLVRKYNPGDGPYERAAAIYDQVASGQISDPTGGATHYYSPAGMQALVNEGSQSNLLPRWLQQENARRNGNTVTIGGHIFTGRADGAPMQQAAPQPTNTPFVPDALFDGVTPDRPAQIATLGQALMAQSAPAPAPILAPPSVQPYTPRRRDTRGAYEAFFNSLRG